MRPKAERCREERLARIVQGLETDVSQADAAAVARALHEEMDAGARVRERLAAEQGDTIACQPGCNACCQNLIMVHEPEAAAVAEWLADPARREAREAFLAAYPGWRARVGDAPERARTRWNAGDTGGYRRAMREVFEGRVMCAFDRDGNCQIHPVRPNACRNCHALETAERCAPDSPDPPKALDFTPLEAFMRKAAGLHRTVQAQMPGRGEGPTALCQRVYELLANKSARAAKPGRNQPCPCGSGRKYKRCCGA